MSNKLTLSSIFQVIDNHMESETQFMFVTDRDLAEIICEYVADNYGLIDEDMELEDKYQDYYVSLYIDEDGLRFICETARGINGEYKTCDAINDSVDYFICTDMSEREVDKYLLGDYCTWSWIKVVEDDENRDEGQCNCEEELEDWQKQIIDIVEDFADRIENDESECGCFLRNTLVDMFFIARQIGFEDGMECGIESVEEKTVNLHIDNVTVNGLKSAEDLIKHLQNLSRVSCV